MQLINHQKVVKHALVLFLLTLSAQAVSSGVDLETIMAKGCLESYTKKYLPKRQHKAFAYARDSEGKERCGWGYASSSVGDAKKTALRHCAKNKIASECRIIDVDGIVKIKEGDFKKLVSPDDRQLSDTELDVFWDEAVDMLEGRCIASFRKYLSLQGYKAFAYTVDDRGLYAFCVRASRAVPGTAEKAALEECNKRRNKKYPPPCKLFAKGNQLLLKPGDYGLTVKPLTLHIAAERKSLRTVMALVENGADVNETNNYGGTPLTEAAWERRLDVVRYLLSQGADLHHKENMGFDALNIAAERGDLKLFKFLLHKGANIETKTDRPGDMPIHHAATRGNTEMVRLLIDKGVDVDVQNNFTMTPLHRAANAGRLEVVKYLVEKGADVNAQTRRGVTPLDEAVHRKREDVAAYLKGKGAKANNPENI